MTKDNLIRAIEAEAIKLPGNKVGFSQPIEMRFNELIAGVQEDLGIKVFGDDFGDAADRVAHRGCSAKVDGAESVKVEQTSGLTFLEIRIDKAEIARQGLNLADVRDLIENPSAGARRD